MVSLMNEISEHQSILVIQGPFNYLDMLPSPPEEIGTVFLLYTQQNRELHQVQSNSPPLLIIMMCHVMSGSRVQQRDDSQQQFLQRLVSDESDHPRIWIFLRQSLGQRDAPLILGCGECSLYLYLGYILE